ncbi:MAG: DegT/DnrJ/EryC1/StrS aminotransferase family protein [Gammaproteobacteria bacterium]|nr:DegT/DnrJ/EryC1/StrS aminotransferase family protein [Gammaproteobacteria bacterium]
MIVANQSRLKLQHGSGSYRRLLLDLAGLNRQSATELREVAQHRFAAYLGTPYLVQTPMCRTGIYLAIKHLIKPGQDVIMSPYTIADVVNMVIAAGGKPVFADVARSSCNLAASSVEALIGPGTGAVLVTHLHGVAAEIEALAALCRSRQVVLVEDAAQAFDAQVGNTKLGTFGDAGVFSFGMYKNINGWFGGAVATPHAELAARLQQELLGQPLQSRGFVAGRLLQGALTDLVTSPWLFSLVTRRLFRLGLTRNIRLINRFIETELDSSRVDTLPPHYLHGCRPAQLALLCQQIDGIAARNEQRRRFANQYLQALEGLPGLILPEPATGDVYSVLPIQVDDRHGLLCHMLRSNCDVAAQHLKNCADLDSFAEFSADCPNASACAAAVVLLPTYPGYGEQQVRRNIAAIREFLSH